MSRRPKDEGGPYRLREAVPKVAMLATRWACLALAQRDVLNEGPRVVREAMVAIGSGQSGLNCRLADLASLWGGGNGGRDEIDTEGGGDQGSD